MAERANQQVPEQEQTGCLSLIARLTWMAFGNLALAVLAVLIVKANGFSFADVLFWATVAGLISVRYIDITRLGGLTADSEPASLRHWYRYAGGLLAASAAAWTLAHFVTGIAVG
jgi:hypothetical protein